MKESIPIRKNTRLNHYDYTKEGGYFITICIKNRKELLGKIKGDKINLTKEGIIVQKYIKKINEIYQNVIVDEYIIMPNHIHLIIIIKNNNQITLTRIIKQFKMKVSKEIENSIWQKLFYEHIIRDNKEYYKIKEYIRNNVINWKKDKYF